MGERAIVKVRIRQSVCRWCFESIGLEKLAQACQQMGFLSIELVQPAEWGVLKEHGLICAMTPSHAIEAGLNHPRNHESCLSKMQAAIDATAAAGFPNMICFSGNREEGLSDEEGLRNCARGLEQIVPYAAAKNVTVVMELLNSKIDHPGYMCDRSTWGANLAQKVASPHFKLLYDIYHMQVQEGDVIATIRRHKDVIGHYHTAGVPGRHELDERQELNYPAVMEAILGTGFNGYVAQEFVPVEDAMEGLKHAARLCDV